MGDHRFICPRSAPRREHLRERRACPRTCSDRSLASRTITATSSGTSTRPCIGWSTRGARLTNVARRGGLTQYLSSQLAGVETTLHDASATLGHDIEIRVDNQGLHDFFSMVSGAAQGWDGADRCARSRAIAAFHAQRALFEWFEDARYGRRLGAPAFWLRSTPGARRGVRSLQGPTKGAVGVVVTLTAQCARNGTVVADDEMRIFD